MKDNPHKTFYSNILTKKIPNNNLLKAESVKNVFIVGVATDYCVKFTALDAANLGYHTYLVEDACRGVNLKLNDVQKATQEMVKAGVQVLESSNVGSHIFS